MVYAQFFENIEISDKNRNFGQSRKKWHVFALKNVRRKRKKLDSNVTNCYQLIAAFILRRSTSLAKPSPQYLPTFE